MAQPISSYCLVKTLFKGHKSTTLNMPFKWGMFLRTYLVIFSLIFVTSCSPKPAIAKDLWKITAYCACKICCGKWADGITASGKPVAQGIVACNILPFKTVVEIQGLGRFTVQDRGARKYFDNQNHLDVYMDSHEAARQFGVKYREVKIIG